MRRNALLPTPALALALALTLALAVCALPAEPAAAPATVILVRHAEKLSGDDPALSEAGRARAAELARVLEETPVSALYASQFRRTAQTLVPLAGRKELEITVHALRRDDLQGSLQELAARILADHAGGVVVVAGHSNTVPVLIEALGAGPVAAIDERDYDDLFVVTAGAGPASVLHLRYGQATP